MRSLYTRFLHAENHVHHRLVQHSITALRIAVGAVFLGFGVLKYFPGISPAQNLTEATTHILFLGVVPGDVAIVIVATLECTIGLLLLANRGMRLAVWLLATEFVGILSPVVLLPGRLFAGPNHAPTLEGQYCLKDIILVAAALVIAAGTFRGGRMVRGDLPPAARVRDDMALDSDQKLRIVLEGIGDASLVSGLCETNHISEAQFYAWRDTSLAGATRALSAEAARSRQAPATVRREAWPRTREHSRGGYDAVAGTAERDHAGADAPMTATLCDTGTASPDEAGHGCGLGGRPC